MAFAMHHPPFHLVLRVHGFDNDQENKQFVDAKRLHWQANHDLNNVRIHEENERMLQRLYHTQPYVGPAARRPSAKRSVNAKSALSQAYRIPPNRIEQFDATKHASTRSRPNSAYSSTASSSAHSVVSSRVPSATARRSSNNSQIANPSRPQTPIGPYSHAYAARARIASTSRPTSSQRYVPQNPLALQPPASAISWQSEEKESNSVLPDEDFDLEQIAKDHTAATASALTRPVPPSPSNRSKNPRPPSAQSGRPASSPRNRTSTVAAASPQQEKGSYYQPYSNHFESQAPPSSQYAMYQYPPAPPVQPANAQYMYPPVQSRLAAFESSVLATTHTRSPTSHNRHPSFHAPSSPQRNRAQPPTQTSQYEWPPRQPIQQPEQLHTDGSSSVQTWTQPFEPYVSHSSYGDAFDADDEPASDIPLADSPSDPAPELAYSQVTNVRPRSAAASYAPTIATESMPNGATRYSSRNAEFIVAASGVSPLLQQQQLQEQQREFLRVKEKLQQKQSAASTFNAHLHYQPKGMAASVRMDLRPSTAGSQTDAAAMASNYSRPATASSFRRVVVSERDLEQEQQNQSLHSSPRLDAATITAHAAPSFEFEVDNETTPDRPHHGGREAAASGGRGAASREGGRGREHPDADENSFDADVDDAEEEEEEEGWSEAEAYRRSRTHDWNLNGSITADSHHRHAFNPNLYPQPFADQAAIAPVPLLSQARRHLQQNIQAAV